MKTLFVFFVSSFLLLGCKTETEKKEGVAVARNEKILKNQDADTSKISVTPVSHATAVITWDSTIISIDPTGGAMAFEGHEKPDLVLITDIHGDHMDAQTLRGLELENTRIIVPQAVKEELTDSLEYDLTVINNREIRQEQNFSIEAIPMYNLREEAKQFHEKGRGNGYVLEKDGQRLYIAGDTEDIPEMRNLKDIDLALIPMNLPYTMTVEKAADAVLEFAPKKVIPYHYRGTEGKADVEKFKQLVNQGNKEIEVELMEWYPEDNKE